MDKKNVWNFERASARSVKRAPKSGPEKDETAVRNHINKIVVIIFTMIERTISQTTSPTFATIKYGFYKLNLNSSLCPFQISPHILLLSPPQPCSTSPNATTLLYHAGLGDPDTFPCANELDQHVAARRLAHSLLISLSFLQLNGAQYGQSICR